MKKKQSCFKIRQTARNISWNPIYIKSWSIKDVDTVGRVLKKTNYYTSYTFNSFENLAVNLSAIRHILMALGILFTLAAIVTAVLLLIN